MKKLILIVLVLVAVGAVPGATPCAGTSPEPAVMTQQLSRGDIVDTRRRHRHARSG